MSRFSDIVARPKLTVATVISILGLFTASISIGVGFVVTQVSSMGNRLDELTTAINEMNNEFVDEREFDRFLETLNWRFQYVQMVFTLNGAVTPNTTPSMGVSPSTSYSLDAPPTDVAPMIVEGTVRPPNPLTEFDNALSVEQFSMKPKTPRISMEKVRGD